MFNNKLIKKFRNLETPFYYYDMALLDRTLAGLKEHGMSKGFHIHFAIKANYNFKILEKVRKAGLGIDCVSGREIERAAEAGFRPDQIAFAGVGKTDKEIETALDHNIYSFNCESLPELQVVHELASKHGKVAPVAVRLNPNVEAKTHKYITTGLNENKFGISADKLPDLFELLPQLNSIKLIGIHFHIGSQISDLTPFDQLADRANELQNLFEAQGYDLQHLNLGGGYAIDYENPDINEIPDFKSFFELFDRKLEIRDGQQVHFELGRSIVGQCGSLISKVLYIKEGTSRDFAIIDAGMTELIRPALYQAAHKIDALANKKPMRTYDVVGPICESSDTFRRGYKMPELSRGDLVAIRSAGAYGEVMSSGFNLRDRVKAYYSDLLI